MVHEMVVSIIAGGCVSGSLGNVYFAPEEDPGAPLNSIEDETVAASRAFEQNQSN